VNAIVNTLAAGRLRPGHSSPHAPVSKAAIEASHRVRGGSAPAACCGSGLAGNIGGAGGAASGSRRMIGSYPIDQGALDRFNCLLRRLGQAPLTLDTLTDFARCLASATADNGTPAWIVARMRRASVLNVMLADPTWDLAGDCRDAARLVMDYVHSTLDLIPDKLPRLGWLDDAILIEAAWPLLSGEVDSYLDFCRVRHLEAQLRGYEDHAFSFSREDWLRLHVASTDGKGHRRVVPREQVVVSLGMTPLED
jgi:uncharacterized membrane protein YkvA (DUF1232 family)